MRTTIQRTQSWTAPRALCFGCASGHHDFKKTVGSEIEAYALVMSSTEAWIDGRRYRRLPYIGTQGMTCSECNRRVPGIYLSVE